MHAIKKNGAQFC